MKEMNTLENQLRSWAPRRPSARLKQRLFASPAQKAELRAVLGWLAPAAACMLLLFSSFVRPNGPGSSRSEPMVAVIFSNQTPVAFLSERPQPRHNTFSSVTFDWTNQNRSTSSTGSFGTVKVTN